MAKVSSLQEYTQPLNKGDEVVFEGIGSLIWNGSKLVGTREASAPAIRKRLGVKPNASIAEMFEVYAMRDSYSIIGPQFNEFPIPE